jgi:hypothetical protein
MPRPTILVSILAALVLLLSACDPAGNGGNGDAAYGEDDLDQAVTSVGNDLGELGTAFETELGVAALDAFPGAFPAVSEPVVVSDGALSLRFIRPSQAGSLPRGIWAWDEGTFDWVDAGDSDDLVLQWTFLDAANDTHTATITVDWGVTTQVRDEAGDLVEVPSAMNVTMTVDTTTVADVDTEFDWYSADTCTDGILEPDRVVVDGSFGVDATLALNAITLEITPVSATDAQVAASGGIVASAEGDRAGLDWDVTLRGPLTRGSDCFIDDFEVESGAVDVLLFSERAGVTSSFGVDLNFDTIVVDDVTGEFVAVDLDGDLSVDGAAAVSFSGTLDDEDDDGIPGDNLLLVFANGDTTTLEAFIESQLETTATAAMRVLSLFR